MYIAKQLAKLKSAAYRDGSENILLGDAYFFVSQTGLEFPKED